MFYAITRRFVGRFYISPLLFCLSVAPLSSQLRTHRGFTGRYQSSLTHLLFMDDLKVFAESLEELADATRTAEDVTHTLGMEFGITKCSVAHVRAGREIGGKGDWQEGTPCD